MRNKMKKYGLIILLVLATTFAFAQKKEKIKGSKIVTIELRETSDFDTLEVEDNLEIYLEKGEKPGIKIEADDNLHDIITTDLRDNILRLSTSKEAVKYKKMLVRVTYTDDLKSVSTKNETVVNAIQEVQLDSIIFKSSDYSQLFLNINTANFVLKADDKSAIELNAKSEKIKIVLSKDAALKSLITANEIGCDLYQKAEANIEGIVNSAVIRLDNNSDFTGTKLTIKNLELITESYSTASVNAETSISISAGEKSEIELYGSPKIRILKFSDEAKLLKKIK
jgi:DNA repair exonuclease SbcCD nuclease subunit